MGKQYNKKEKKSRRIKYLRRLKTRAASQSSKQDASAPAATS